MKQPQLSWTILYMIIFSLAANCQKEKVTHMPLLKIGRERIDNYDPNFYNYIQNLSWKDSLDLWDLSMIDATIDSSNYDEMQANVMTPVIVHRLHWVSQRDTLWRWESFRKYLSESPRMTDLRYDKFLLRSIDAETLSTKTKLKSSHYWSVNDGVLQALVIRQCKLLRQGLPMTVSIPPDWLNVYQESLIRYSQMEENTAIDSLLYEIRMLGDLIREKETAPVTTLMTYARKASQRSLAIVLDSTAFRLFPRHGQRYLLNHVTHRANLDFTPAEKSDLIKYLYTETVYKGVMKDFITQIAFIAGRLTGDDWKECLGRLGYMVDEENRMVPIPMK